MSKLYQNIEITPATGVRQLNGFAQSALPRTMQLADEFRSDIVSLFDEGGTLLPFHDRVLAWLEPALHRDIAHFHGASGESLSQLISPQSTTHLDIELRQRLIELLSAKSDTFIGVLKEPEK